MTRDELIRRLRRLSREKGLAFDVDQRRGKGGHWMVQLGDRRQPVPQAKGGDLPTGTLRSILRNFGLKPGDVE